MPRQLPEDRVEDAVVAQSGSGNLWMLDSDGYQWVHSNFFICVPPEINTHFVTSSKTPLGEVPIIVSMSINRIACLVRFRDDIVA